MSNCHHWLKWDFIESIIHIVRSLDLFHTIEIQIKLLILLQNIFSSHFPLCSTSITQGCPYPVIMDFTFFWKGGDLPTGVFHWKACTTAERPRVMQMSAHQHFTTCCLQAHSWVLECSWCQWFWSPRLSCSSLLFPPSGKEVTRSVVANTLLEIRGPRHQGHTVLAFTIQRRLLDWQPRAPQLPSPHAIMRSTIIFVSLILKVRTIASPVLSIRWQTLCDM